MRTDVVAQHHDDPLAGHFEVEKTLNLLQQKYYWPNPGNNSDASIGMREFTKQYCNSCAICKRSKSQRHKPYGEIQSLPIPEFKWADITMDFVTGLPASKDWTGTDFDSILVVVDRLTKMVHYIPVTKTIIARALAQVLIKEMIRFHGSQLHCDRSWIVVHFRFLFFAMLRIKDLKKSSRQLFSLRPMAKRNAKIAHWSSTFERM